jgi:hypothetical protein
MNMVSEYSEKVKMLMQLHYGRLSEKDRRLYAAVEAVKLGHGGVAYISKVLSIDCKTIWQGKKELLKLVDEPQCFNGKQRVSGGGRKKNGIIS